MGLPITQFTDAKAVEKPRFTWFLKSLDVVKLPCLMLFLNIRDSLSRAADWVGSHFHKGDQRVL